MIESLKSKEIKETIEYCFPGISKTLIEKTGSTIIVSPNITDIVTKINEIIEVLNNKEVKA